MAKKIQVDVVTPSPAAVSVTAVNSAGAVRRASRENSLAKLDLKQSSAGNLSVDGGNDLSQYFEQYSPAHVQIAHAHLIPNELHRDVLEAAIMAMKPALSQDTIRSMHQAGQSGNWLNGTLMLGVGPYYLRETLYLPARTNLVGAEGAFRQDQAGSSFRAIGSDWNPQAYLVFWASSGQGNFNGNFAQHCSNIGFNCANRCRGVFYSGAQSSEMDRCWVTGFTDTGIQLSGGRPVLLRTVTVEFGQSGCVCVRSDARALNLLNCSLSFCEQAIVHVNGSLTATGLMLEHVTGDAIEILQGSDVLLDGMNFQSGSSAKQNFLVSNGGTVRFSGTIRNKNSEAVWLNRSGGDNEILLKGVTSATNPKYPFAYMCKGSNVIY